MLNVFLTCLWFAIGTAISFLAAQNYSPEHLSIFTSLGFFCSVVLRFIPECAGDMAVAVIESID